jgi:hypothetical protein
MAAGRTTRDVFENHLEWAIDGDGVCIDDGVGTFVIRDGKIVAMTVRYTVRKQGSA